MINLLLTHKATVFLNWIFKSFLTRFVFMFTFLTILNIMFFPYPMTGTILILIVSIIFSTTIKRVSNNFNLNLITGTLNMSLINPKEYQQFSYTEEKDKVSEKLKKDFIEGILKASSYKKNIKMNTHKWMVGNVINDKMIKSCFDIKIIENKKPVYLKTEILILINKVEITFKHEIIKEIINRKRKKYIAKLRRKEE